MYTHLEDYIYNLYRSIGVQTPSDLNLHKIAKELKVELVYKETPFRFDNEIIIRHGTECEEWMTFGHEICHFLRHCGSQLNLHPLFIELQEWQADNFMYQFCIPTFMLQNMNLSRNRKKAIWEILKVFNVSYEFAEFRLESFCKNHGYAMLS